MGRMQNHEILKRRIRERCLRVSDCEEFRLASGRMSRYYIDLKEVTLDPEGLGLLGEALYEAVAAEAPDAAGGLTLGADPLAYALALESARRGKIIRPFVVRKEPKSHGTEKWIEGHVKAGNRVVILEDVATTGGSSLKAAQAARDAGLMVLRVLPVVDRMEGARQAIEGAGFNFQPLFTIQDLLNS